MLVSAKQLGLNSGKYGVVAVAVEDVVFACRGVVMVGDLLGIV